ncbi:COX15/CtaA family protein [Aestuariivirga litoralis]|uniref:COX15/CtaA family protein n=1 Tax=Aestuariivirga litoralis TaxID=2650924 RepID=UPI0018C74D0B|nr:COX15/CtaA family protein [Aestuariivirga litoralis]
MLMQQAAKPVSHWVTSWLILIALMIATMVVVGGATRLTGSGLSITEWKPIMGAIPPLNSADWELAFSKYQQSSQFKLQNSAMTLQEFEFIFWWEWAHRLLGRLIGVVFFLPFVIFAALKMLPKRIWPQLIGIFILGGLQGALGWYMVASGLVDRVSVSQYRLAAHLTLAAIIFAFVLWVAFALNRRHHRPKSGAAWLGLSLVPLILLQIAAGGFVAGLDAGQGYNTWPLMEGALLPAGLGTMQPWWANLFENALTVQFDHRLLAYLICVLVLVRAFIARNTSSLVLLAFVLIQIGLGITTLLLHVPLDLALLHQSGAMALLAASVWNLSRLTR